MPRGKNQPIPKIEINKDISPLLLKTLQERFENNVNRHKDLDWSKVQSKLKANPQSLASLNAMEHTGGEPDVVGFYQKTDKYIFIDCSTESPNRRSICYDREGEQMRNKKNIYTGGNAVDLAAAMGIELLTEEQYRQLQMLGDFDIKTSSWIKTPAKIRNLGGALFGDFRYKTVFIYHNGAESFYSSRGFRGMLKI